MSIGDFLRGLYQTGRVRFTADDALVDSGDAASSAASSTALEEVEAMVREEMAFEPPGMELPVAEWAGRMLAAGCFALAHRELSGEQVTAMLSAPCPLQSQRTAAGCYSADLAFRFLPDLIALARGLAEEDPLVVALKRLAVEWPLSSVGVREVGEVDVSAFIGDRALRQLYVDRIIERQDLSRVREGPVFDAVRAALGAHHRELAPAFEGIYRERE